MKFFVVLSLLVTVSLALPYVPYVPPGWATADTYEEFQQQVKEAYGTVDGSKTSGDRIASGTDAKKGEFPEFCYLNVGFFQKQQMCGCWVLDQQYVVTSARCLWDCSEGKAANVTVNFPQLSGKDAVARIDTIYFPDAVNNAMMQFATATYDITMDGMGNDFHKIAPANMAVIKLMNPILGDKWAASKDIRKAKADPAVDRTAWETAHDPKMGWKFRACGVGVIGNKGERAKGVVCTEVAIAATGACVENYNQVVISDQANQLCLQWPDRDNNICVGDFGGPVYAYKLDMKGMIDAANQEVFCTLVASPNVRTNAQCLDGHVTLCEFYAGPAAANTADSAPSWAAQFVPVDGK